MYVQAWVDFVQMRQEAAHHASTSSRLCRRLQLQHHPSSASQPTTEAIPLHDRRCKLSTMDNAFTPSFAPFFGMVRHGPIVYSRRPS